MQHPTAFFYSPPNYNPNERQAYPVMLLCRRAIEESFETARKCRDGAPTEDALDAVVWLEDILDWTRLRNSDGITPIPPKEIQAEFVLSFEYCCRCLELDPAHVRENGLPSTRLWRENVTQGGLPRIYRLWAEERGAWLAKQESVADVTLEIPVSATCAPEPPSATAFD